MLQAMLVLLYHGVRPANDTTSPDIRRKHVPERAFANQLHILSKLFHIIPLSAAVETLCSGGRPRWNDCVITFDDGYANNAETAAPLLKAMGMPATFFVTTDFIEGKTKLWVDRFELAFSQIPGAILEITVDGEDLVLWLNDEARAKSDERLRERLKKVPLAERERVVDELERLANTQGKSAPLHRPMSLDQVRWLVANDFEVGAHTKTHPILSQCPVEQMRDEIHGSKAIIEKELGRPCRHFAHPNGQPSDWNDAVMHEVREAFSSCCTTVGRHVKINDDPYEIPRVTVDTGSDIPKFLLTVTGIRTMLGGIKRRL